MEGARTIRPTGKSPPPALVAPVLQEAVLGLIDLSVSYLRGYSPLRDEERATLEAVVVALGVHRRRPRSEGFRSTRLDPLGRRLGQARLRLEIVLLDERDQDDTEDRQERIAAAIGKALDAEKFQVPQEEVRRLLDQLRRECRREKGAEEDWISAYKGPREAAGMVLERLLDPMGIAGNSKGNTNRLRNVANAEFDEAEFAGPAILERYTFFLCSIGVPVERAVWGAYVLSLVAEGAAPWILTGPNHPSLPFSRFEQVPPVPYESAGASQSSDDYLDGMLKGMRAQFEAEHPGQELGAVADQAWSALRRMIRQSAGVRSGPSGKPPVTKA